jgi:hypothetical protein
MCTISDSTIFNCSGGNTSGTSLIDIWQNNDCLAAYSTYLYNNNGNLQYNPDAQPELQGCVSSLFNSYLQNYDLTDNVTDPRYNNFQETLFQLCTADNVPGVCTTFLSSYCNSFTREQITNSAVLTNLCGCYTPPDSTFLNITHNPGCDPLCNRILTSKKLLNTTDDTLESCEQNVCVIDDVVVNALNSRSANGLTISSICTGCGDSGCLCVIAGTNIPSTLNNIGVGVNFQQFCGTNSTCITQDDNGNIVSSGPCSNINFSNTGETSFPLPIFGWIIIYLLLLVILLILVFYREA